MQTKAWLYHMALPYIYVYTFFILNQLAKHENLASQLGQEATSKALVRLQIRDRSFRRPGAGPWVQWGHAPV